MSATDPMTDAVAWLLDQAYDEDDDTVDDQPQEYVAKTDINSILPWGATQPPPDIGPPAAAPAAASVAATPSGPPTQHLAPTQLPSIQQHDDLFGDGGDKSDLFGDGGDSHHDPFGSPKNPSVGPGTSPTSPGDHLHPAGPPPSSPQPPASTTATNPEQSGGSSSSTDPFSPDGPLNHRIRLFIGKPGALDVDALAFDLSYSSLTKGTGHHLLRLGGAKLTKELANVERMRSGQADLVKGNFGNLYVQKLAPFVGPNYKEKYKTAARNTLCACVRAILEKCSDEKMRTVALPCRDLVCRGRGPRGGVGSSCWAFSLTM